MSESVQSISKTQYLADVAQAAKSPGPKWLLELRKAAAVRLAELEFPNRRQEEWRFTNIAPIVNTSFRSMVERLAIDLRAADIEPFVFREEGWTELVFVNGFYQPSLSRIAAASTNVRCGDLTAAAGSVVEHLDRYGANGNIFTALNSAFLAGGAYVHIPAGQVMEHPIHLVFVSAGRSENTAAYPRTLVIAEPQSQAVLVESHVHLEGNVPYFNNSVTEVVVKENAHVHAYRIVQEGASSYHLSTTKVHQAAASVFKSFAVTLSGKIVRNELSVLLDGEGADCSLQGLYLTGGDQLVDNATAIEHAQPRCTSWIGYKGVLDGRSHGVFTGKIKVRRHAQKTDSKQLNNNLLLSDEAVINTKPLLEIFADDVKCTHGATVGRPPEEVIFYFKSRGISEAMAQGMLTCGFCDALLSQMELEPVRQRLDNVVFERYSPI